MVLHYLWFLGFLFSLLFAVFQCIFEGDWQIFERMVNALFKASEQGAKITIGMIGVMSFFLGMLKVGEAAGVIHILSNAVYPLFSKIFPKIEKGSVVLGEMMMNFSANLLGLDNAATPFGLKAMQSLQKRNPNPEVASDEQIMFVALHSSGLTIIPISVITQRVLLSSSQPTSIFIPTILTTAISTIAIITMISIKQQLSCLKFWFFLSLFLFFGSIFFLVSYVSQVELAKYSSILGNLVILLIFFSFCLISVRKKLSIYDNFILGAKEGFETSLRILPYLIGMLAMIALWRSSGIFDLILKTIAHGLQYLQIKTDILNALPVAIMKPFSGAAARALMIDTMQTHGADSFIGQLACIFQGSSDTTFYIISLYFGVVNIRKIRYTLSISLLADFIGIVSAILLALVFF